MIEFYGARVAHAFFACSELGMAIFEAADVCREMRCATVGAQNRVASGARLTARGGEVDFAAMLDVAFSTVERARLFGVVNGTVVAGEACGIFGLGVETAGLLDVAGGALRFKHGVRFAESAAG